MSAGGCSYPVVGKEFWGEFRRGEVYELRTDTSIHQVPGHRLSHLIPGNLARSVRVARLIRQGTRVEIESVNFYSAIDAEYTLVNEGSSMAISGPSSVHQRTVRTGRGPLVRSGAESWIPGKRRRTHPDYLKSSRNRGR